MTSKGALDSAAVVGGGGAVATGHSQLALVMQPTREGQGLQLRIFNPGRLLDHMGVSNLVVSRIISFCTRPFFLLRVMPLMR